MKAYTSLLTPYAVTFFLVALLIACPLLADPDDDEVIKFEQLPMLMLSLGFEGPYYGHDEESRAGLTDQDGSTNVYQGNAWMADDFADTVNSQIVHVEWWGSYIDGGPDPQHDPSTIKFLIEFLDDDPAGPEGRLDDNPHSLPGTPLQYEVVSFDPSGGHPSGPGYYTESMELPSGTNEPVFHYNAELKYPFPQQADTVYWLKIVALVLDPATIWGWHNRDYTIMNLYASPAVSPGERIVGILGDPLEVPVYHFQDNAVRGQQIVVVIDTNNMDHILQLQEPIDWQTVLPQMYTTNDGPAPEILNQSKDLAFRLYYREPRHEPKWDRPLDTDHGIDIVSYCSESTFMRVADDFVSDGRPITGIRWYGSYPNYMTNQPPGHPIEPPSGLEHPVAFILEWWADVPRGMYTNYSYPGAQLKYKRYELAPAGPVTENHYTSIYHQGKGWVHEFVYDIAFTNYHDYWNEKEGVVYWLSVMADYFPLEPTNGWGWATTSLEHHWNDDAVRNAMHWPYWEELFYDDVWPGHFYGTNSVDMAFALHTDVIGRRAKKWRQPPDMVDGENMAAFVRQEEEGLPGALIRADDFVSDGRRITDVHWWGSYIGWQTNFPAPPEPPDPGPPNYNVLGFWLSWHTDIPTNGQQTYSMPSEPALERFYVPIEKCHEVYYGTVHQYWKTLPPPEPQSYEHEYQYYVDLLDPEINDGQPWLETNGVIYWLDIQAVLSNAWEEQGAPHRGWGWKTTHPDYQWQDVSAVASYPPLGGGPLWQPGAYPGGPPQHPHFDAPMDLAFELTTDEVGTNRWYSPIVITNLTETGTNEFKVESVGTSGAGKQYLQLNTNMLTTNWVDIATNPLPLLPPSINPWTRPGAGSNEFYRIKER